MQFDLLGEQYGCPLGCLKSQDWLNVRLDSEEEQIARKRIASVQSAAIFIEFLLIVIVAALAANPEEWVLFSFSLILFLVDRGGALLYWLFGHHVANVYRKPSAEFMEWAARNASQNKVSSESAAHLLWVGSLFSFIHILAKDVGCKNRMTNANFFQLSFLWVIYQFLTYTVIGLTMGTHHWTAMLICVFQGAPNAWNIIQIGFVLSKRSPYWDQFFFHGGDEVKTALTQSDGARDLVESGVVESKEEDVDGTPEPDEPDTSSSGDARGNKNALPEDCCEGCCYYSCILFTWLCAATALALAVTGIAINVTLCCEA